jgi:hypothetical protein
MNRSIFLLFSAYIVFTQVFFKYYKVPNEKIFK